MSISGFKFSRILEFLTSSIWDTICQDRKVYFSYLTETLKAVVKDLKIFMLQVYIFFREYTDILCGRLSRKKTLLGTSD